MRVIDGEQNASSVELDEVLLLLENVFQEALDICLNDVEKEIVEKRLERRVKIWFDGNVDISDPVVLSLKL